MLWTIWFLTAVAVNYWWLERSAKTPLLLSLISWVLWIVITLLQAGFDEVCCGVAVWSQGAHPAPADTELEWGEGRIHKGLCDRRAHLQFLHGCLKIQSAQVPGWLLATHTLCNTGRSEQGWICGVWTKEATAQSLEMLSWYKYQSVSCLDQAKLGGVAGVFKRVVLLVNGLLSNLGNLGISKALTLRHCVFI